MKLIIGLGNPGVEYAKNRHNIGFMAIDELAASMRVGVKNFMCKSLVGEGTIGGRTIVLAKPITYMNLSGEAVGLLLTRFRSAPSEMIVICDDMDLDLGKVRIRPKGGDGGHKGLGSIIEKLSTNEFPRIRVGIGRPTEDVLDYVLGNFSPEELVTITQSMEKVRRAVLCVSREGLDMAMNRYNG